MKLNNYINHFRRDNILGDADKELLAIYTDTPYKASRPINAYKYVAQNYEVLSKELHHLSRHQ